MTHLTPTSTVATPVRAIGAHAAPTVTALAKALREENQLLLDLASILKRQREALARDDLQGLDDSVFATHRVLVTLGEARRRRITLNQRLGEADDLSMTALLDTFGGNPPAEVQAAIDALTDTGDLLHHEVQLNQRVLRTAVEAGDQLVRALAGALQPPSTYDRDGGQPGDPGLLDRTI